MRIFVAIDMPRHVKDQLIESTKIIKDNCVSCLLVPETNYHITCAFIGDVDKSAVDKVVKITDESFTDSFDLSIMGFEKFTKPYGDIIYRRGVVDNKTFETLLSFKKKLQEADIPVDGEVLKPHITISRKTVFKDGLSTGSFPLPEIKCHIDRITVFQSILSDDKPAAYRVIHERILK